MNFTSTTIRSAREALAAGSVAPVSLPREALQHDNRNAGKTTYLWRNPDWTMEEAARAAAMRRPAGGEFGDGRSNLWGIPVSVKDCFGLAGSPTSCGVL